MLCCMSSLLWPRHSGNLRRDYVSYRKSYSPSVRITSRSRPNASYTTAAATTSLASRRTHKASELAAMPRAAWTPSSPSTISSTETKGRAPAVTTYYYPSSSTSLSPRHGRARESSKYEVGATNFFSRQTRSSRPYYSSSSYYYYKEPARKSSSSPKSYRTRTPAKKHVRWADQVHYQPSTPAGTPGAAATASASTVRRERRHHHHELSRPRHRDDQDAYEDSGYDSFEDHGSSHGSSPRSHRGRHASYDNYDSYGDYDNHSNNSSYTGYKSSGGFDKYTRYGSIPSPRAAATFRQAAEFREVRRVVDINGEDLHRRARKQRRDSLAKASY